MALTDDYLVALQLQQQFDFEDAAAMEQGQYNEVVEVFPSGSGTSFGHGDRSYVDCTDRPSTSRQVPKPSSVTDTTWEMIDPTPDARALFVEFSDKYFWGKLTSVEVKWSSRMTLCAGVCDYEGQGGLCSIRLSEPLLKLRPRKDLVETLLHEMIHAYLFVTNNNKDRNDHGPEFLKHMARLNQATGANITVYHNFHDEVDVYRQHWWHCNGPCQKRSPYFGYVKRAMNRAPSSRDTWWAEHNTMCGGTYTKIKEPEGFGEKKKKSNQESKVPNGRENNKNTQKSLNGIWGTTSEIKGAANGKPMQNNSMVSTSNPAYTTATVKAGWKQPSVVDVDDFSDEELVSAVAELEESFNTKADIKAEKVESFTGKGYVLGQPAAAAVRPASDVASGTGRFLPGIGFVPVRLPSENKSSAETVTENVVKNSVEKNSEGARASIDRFLVKKEPTDEAPRDTGQQRGVRKNRDGIRAPYGVLGDMSQPIGAVIRVRNFVSVHDPRYKEKKRAISARAGKEHSKADNHIDNRSKLRRIRSDDDPHQLATSKKIRLSDEDSPENAKTSNVHGVITNPNKTPPPSAAAGSERTAEKTSTSGARSSTKYDRLKESTILDSNSDEDEKKTLASVISKLGYKTVYNGSSEKDLPLSSGISKMKVESSSPFSSKSSFKSIFPTQSSVSVVGMMSNSEDRPISRIGKIKVESSPPISTVTAVFPPQFSTNVLGAASNSGVASRVIVSDTVSCPVCSAPIPAASINDHLDTCLQ